MKNRKDESRAFQEWDEDADIDESGKLCLELKLSPGALIMNIFNNQVLRYMYFAFSKKLVFLSLLFKI